MLPARFFYYLLFYVTTLGNANRSVIHCYRGVCKFDDILNMQSESHYKSTSENILLLARHL